MKMSSTNEVKRESEGKLSEASANEKYLLKSKVGEESEEVEEEKERAESGGC